MSTFRKAPVTLFLSLFLFWILFTGRLEWSALLTGLAVSLVITRITWRIFLPPVHAAPRPVAPAMHFRFREILILAGLFLYDIVKATVEVAILALSPEIRLMPGIVRADSKLKSKTALVILANQITLTPGTLTVDTDLVNHGLFVHSLNLKTLDECTVCEQVAKIEKLLRRIFE
ncbi:MAG: Na+/H+ antiporter subunit E [Thermovirgaceae bacterium]